jgi:hypothetical protein
MSAGRTRAAYINTGTYTTPVWVMMSRISGVQRAQGRGTAERKYRGARNVKTVTGYMKYGFTFKYHIKAARLQADTVVALLEGSVFNETTLDVCFLNQRIIQPVGFPVGANAVGVRGPMVCTKCDISEEDEEGVTYDVELAEVEDEQPAGTLIEVAAYSVAVASS